MNYYRYSTYPSPPQFWLSLYDINNYIFLNTARKKPLHWNCTLCVTKSEQSKAKPGKLSKSKKSKLAIKSNQRKVINSSVGSGSISRDDLENCSLSKQSKSNPVISNEQSKDSKPSVKSNERKVINSPVASGKSGKADLEIASNYNSPLFCDGCKWWFPIPDAEREELLKIGNLSLSIF